MAVCSRCERTLGPDEESYVKQIRFLSRNGKRCYRAVSMDETYCARCVEIETTQLTVRRARDRETSSSSPPVV
jgi:hypothetical protein